MSPEMTKVRPFPFPFVLYPELLDAVSSASSCVMLSWGGRKPQVGSLWCRQKRAT